MNKKAMIIPLLIFLVNVVLAASCLLYKFYWPIGAPGDPNAILPQDEGHALINHTGTAVSFGLDYIAIVKENGELWIWSMDSVPSTQDEPFCRFGKTWKLADHVADAVHVGTDTNGKRGAFLCVLYEDMSLWAWDISTYREGNREIPSSHFEQTPEKVMEGVSAIMANGLRSSSFWALKTDGSLWTVWRKRAQTESSFEFEYREYAFERKMEKVHAVWVNPVYNTQIYVLRESGALFGFGENARGQLGVGFEYGNAKHVYMKYPARIANSIVYVIPQSEESEIHMHTMAIKKDRSLWMWGRDIIFEPDSTAAQYASEYSSFSNKPVKIMEDVAFGAMGVNHCLVVKQDGSLWAWGYNDAGQAGVGHSGSVKTPQRIMEHVVSVAASNRHSLAVQADGSLWAWGDNEVGQLGTGDTKSRTSPTKIMEDVNSVFVTSTLNAAVKRDGSVWIWGNAAISPGSFVDEENSILKPVCILR